MKFALTNFTQDGHTRQYMFQGIAPGGKRTEWQVGVDLNELHKHGIPLQEAPLLCSLLLSTQSGQDENRRLMISERELQVRAEQRASERTEAQNKRKPALTPPQPETSALAPANPAHGYGSLGIGLGSRPAYPWVPALQNTTKR